MSVCANDRRIGEACLSERQRRRIGYQHARYSEHRAVNADDQLSMLSTVGRSRVLVKGEMCSG